MENSEAWQLWSEMQRVYVMIKNREERVLGKLGLTSEQFGVLIAIHPNNSARVTDIAYQVTRSVNSVSMIVDRMVKAGLVRRVRDKKDRRTVNVYLTEKAKSVLGQAIQLEEDFVLLVFSDVSLGGKQTLIERLKSFQDRVEELLSI